jgi:hypothetical protein
MGLGIGLKRNPLKIYGMHVGLLACQNSLMSNGKESAEK